MNYYILGDLASILSPTNAEWIESDELKLHDRSTVAALNLGHLLVDGLIRYELYNSISHYHVQSHQSSFVITPSQVGAAIGQSHCVSKVADDTI